MNEQQIRKIVKEEMDKNYRSGSPMTSPHDHDGNNGLKINEGNLTAGLKYNGTITMSQNTMYYIPFNGNPKSLTFYGGALTTSGSGKHAMVVGSCQIGRGYQFQTGTSTTVTLNGVETPFIQGSASLLIDDANVNNTVIRNSEGHIVYVEDISNNIVALATVTSFSDSKVSIYVELASGWQISGLWTII